MRDLINLIESFNKVLPVHWYDRSEEGISLYQAEFQIDDGMFIVQFLNKHYNPGVWELSFVRNNELVLSGTGNAMVVFSTVIQCVREFVNAINPKMLEFYGKNSETSRNKLYPKLIKMLMKEFPDYVQRKTKEVGLKDRYTQYSVERERKGIGGILTNMLRKPEQENPNTTQR